MILRLIFVNIYSLGTRRPESQLMTGAGSCWWWWRHDDNDDDDDDDEVVADNNDDETDDDDDDDDDTDFTLEWSKTYITWTL